MKFIPSIALGFHKTIKFIVQKGRAINNIIFLTVYTRF